MVVMANCDWNREGFGGIAVNDTTSGSDRNREVVIRIPKEVVIRVPRAFIFQKKHRSSAADETRMNL